MDQALLESMDDAGSSSQQRLTLLAAHPSLVLPRTFAKAYGWAAGWLSGGPPRHRGHGEAIESDGLKTPASP